MSQHDTTIKKVYVEQYLKKHPELYAKYLASQEIYNITKATKKIKFEDKHPWRDNDKERDEL